jgi:phage terminase large subunit
MNVVLPFDYEPRWYQTSLWEYMQKGGFRKKRAAIIWPRRHGKDLNAVNLISTAMAERPGLYWHVFPTYAQGKKIAWDGKTKDGRPFRSHFPPSLVTGENNTEMKLTLGPLNSIYQVVGADKPDSLVGSNPVGVVFSEWSLMAPYVWDLIQPILAENEGWAIFIYTPRGKNHGYKIFRAADKTPGWFAQLLKNSQTKVVTPEAIQSMRDGGMPDEMIEQEMECSFEAPVAGSYYGKLITTARTEGRITRVPWEPKLPVHTAWDIGVSDATSIWFYQQYGLEIRIIDYFESSGEGLPYYAKKLKEGHRAFYVYGKFNAPHDISVKEFGTGRSRIEIARDLGIKFWPVPKHAIEDGIEAVRSILPRCWFDEQKCEQGIEALNQYHKEWDELRLVFKDAPMHDWSSHGADAFRTLGWGFKDTFGKRKGPPQRYAQADYNVLGTIG